MWLLRHLKPGDFILIFFLSLATFFSWGVTYQKKPSGQIATVSVQNGPIQYFSLRENKLIILDGKRGQCMLRIQNGKIRMEESNCPLKICQHQGWISKPGEMILCIPNQLYVRIEGNQENSLDAITM